MGYKKEAGGIVFPLFLVVVFLSIVAAGVVEFTKLTRVNPTDPIFFEKDPPIITWESGLVGLGADPVEVGIRVDDNGSGLDEVLVRVSQNNQPQQFIRKRSLGGVKSQELKVRIDPKELELREGKAEVQVMAFDQSIWSNGSRLSKGLIIDFLKPRIEVITPQQNAVLGGSELVFYRVVGKRPDSHGVYSGGVLYPGFPAKYWDEAFKSYDDLYLAFFPVPQSFDDSTTKMTLLARDTIGNSASAPFNYRVRPRKWGSFNLELEASKAETLKTTLGAHPANESIKARFSGNLATDLRYLIKASARHDDSLLSDPLSRSEGRRLWQGPFIRPLSTSPANSAGDVRTITLGGEEIYKGPAAGVRFQVSTRQRVVAANRGVVSFVDTLPLSGVTVVIDHGFGLSTVYAHLSEASVKGGEEVEKGRQIGLTGTTGLAQSEEVYFEVRLHGASVSPNEWWDDTWIKDHLENKVSFVERTLAGDSGESP